jgi:hypothetical protein
MIKFVSELWQIWWLSPITLDSSTNETDCKILSRTRPQFDNSSVIIAGDWNVVQDYRVDTLNYTGENNPKYANFCVLNICIYWTL